MEWGVCKLDAQWPPPLPGSPGPQNQHHLDKRVQVGFKTHPGAFYVLWVPEEQRLVVLATAANKENCRQSARTILTNDFFLFSFSFLNASRFLPLNVALQQILGFYLETALNKVPSEPLAASTGKWEDGEEKAMLWVPLLGHPEFLLYPHHLQL